MSNFYEKKQAEIQEEVQFLLEEKRQRKVASNKLHEQILELKSEMDYLAEEEEAIIERLSAMTKSGIRFYGVNIGDTRQISIYGSHFINHSLSHLESLSKTFKIKDDENE